MKIKKSWLVSFCLIAIGILWLTWISNEEELSPRSSIISNISSQVDEGFARADGDLALNFPENHGAHPDFQTEWWYFTGNLQTENGDHFGYQLTFFRRALLPEERVPARPSRWASNQVYMAHFALSDISKQEYQAYERLSRGSLNLAGVQANPFQVWLQDWSVEEIDPDPDGRPRYRMQARQESVELDLILKDMKGPILQGDQGLSQKGPQKGQASYYYSLTRLESTGSVSVDNKQYPVRGSSWMDHEFSTSALSQDQIGWDWFSIQLEDKSELMVFQIRKADGSIDPFSSGTWIAPDGSTLKLTQKDFTIKIIDTWQSPQSGTVYPSQWVLEIPKLEAEWSIEPQLANQELKLSYTYWEGAVKINGQIAGQAVSGHGYVELTGYSSSIGGEF